MLNITDGEKIIIGLLCDLKDGKDQSGLDTDKVREAIYGRPWVLPLENNWLFPDHPLPPEIREIFDVLDMWSIIERHAKNVDSAEFERLTGRKLSNFKFTGYDGNHESQCGDAQYIVEKLGRFEEFKGRAFNSHATRAPQYAAMFKRFDELRPATGDRNLTVEELAELSTIEFSTH